MKRRRPVPFRTGFRPGTAGKNRVLPAFSFPEGEACRYSELISYLCRPKTQHHVSFFHIQGAIQTKPPARTAGRAHAARTDSHAVCRQPHGRPVRRRRPPAPGGRIVRRRGVLHPLHRLDRNRPRHDPAHRGALRPGKPRTILASAAERNPLLRRPRNRHDGLPIRHHPAHVSPRAARRGGRRRHPLLQNAGVEHALRDALLRLQAVPRRGGQHEGRDGRHDHRQPGQCRLQLGIHLRTLRPSRDGGRGRRTGNPPLAPRY